MSEKELSVSSEVLSEIYERHQFTDQMVVQKLQASIDARLAVDQDMAGVTLKVVSAQLINIPGKELLTIETEYTHVNAKHMGPIEFEPPISEHVPGEPIQYVPGQPQMAALKLVNDLGRAELTDFRHAKIAVRWSGPDGVWLGLSTCVFSPQP